MSKIFFNKVSVIDHAIVDVNGKASGGSYNLNFTAEMPSNQMTEEQVVVDFSSGKKEVKELIDRHSMNDPWQNGFDHKLWVPVGVPGIEFGISGTIMELSTPFFNMVGSVDAFRFIRPNVDVGEQMEMFINGQLGGKTGATYKVKLDEDAYPNVLMGKPNNLAYFDYTHGLRNSSSYGCANILHGHRSFVRVSHRDVNEGKMLAHIIAAYLDGSYIYHKDVRETGDVFSYLCRRGRFSLEFKQEQKYIELMNEPTVENIFDHIWQKFNLGSDSGIIGLEISEGLQKGASL